VIDWNINRDEIWRTGGFTVSSTDSILFKGDRGMAAMRGGVLGAKPVAHEEGE